MITDIVGKGLPTWRRRSASHADIVGMIAISRSSRSSPRMTQMGRSGKTLCVGYGAAAAIAVNGWPAHVPAAKSG
jgi:hypothetical protein